MAAMGVSGSRVARRDARVKRIHIARGQYTLCNRPRTDGDKVWTQGNLLGETPSNLCKRCRQSYLR